jgi:hypothetical protein
VFVKALRPDRTEGGDEAESAVKEIIHGGDVDLPQLDSFGEQRPPSTTRVA